MGGAGGYALSPDGRSLAYTASVRGRMGSGMYLATLDNSSSPRLLVQLETWMVDAPVWSPDGQWLVVNIGNPDDYTVQPASALLNINDCSVVPLNTYEGTAQVWVK